MEIHLPPDSTVNQRVRLIREVYKLSQAEVAEVIGLKRPAISKIEKGTQEVPLSLIEFYCRTKNVNPEWLLFNEGGMFKPGPEPEVLPNTKAVAASLVEEKQSDYISGKTIRPVVATVDNIGRDNITLVEARAAAGYLNGFADPEYVSHLPAFTLPGLTDKTYRAFEVRGDSMEPTLAPNDIICASYVEDWLRIRDTYIYVVVTRTDGITVKRVLNRLDVKGKGYLMCRSDNTIYSQFKVYPEEVIEIWQVHARITWNMPAPDRGVEKKMNDLELTVDSIGQRVVELEQMLLKKLGPV